MNWIKTILDRVLGKEKRNAERKPSPELAAYYWNGGHPTEHAIRDVSPTGLFLITKEPMYPGTLVVMTLQRKDLPDDDAGRTLTVQSKAVRCDSDGVGLEFVLPEFDDPRRGQKLLSEGTDRKTLKKFLEDLEDSSQASVSGAAIPLAQELSNEWA